MSTAELHNAILQNALPKVKQLVTNSAALHGEDESKRTALMIAAMHGNLESVRYAMAAGADLDREDIAGRTAFLWAAGEGSTNVVEYFLSSFPAAVDTHVTLSGNSALHRAAAYGHAPVIRVLLRARAHIDDPNENGETALIRACRWGHEDAARLLVQAGADVSLQDKQGKTALMWANEKGFAEVSSILATEKPLPSVLSPTAKVKGSGNNSNNEYHHHAGVDTSFASTASSSSSMQYGGGIDDDDDAENGDGFYGEGPQPVRVEGWMAKQGHIIRNWKNRWFTLDGRNITYFTKEGATKSKGMIRMAAGTDVIVEEKYSKPYCFTLITPTKKFILQAANENEMEEWIEAIQTNLECCPPDDGLVATTKD